MATHTIARRPTIETIVHGETLALEFIDGRKLVIDTRQLPEGIIQAAIMHGLKQKLVDAAAIARDPETGATATIDTKFAAVKEVYDRITARDGSASWNKVERSGGGATGGLLFRALVRLYDGRKTPEELAAFLETKDAKQQAALRGTPQVAAMIDTIKAEDAARKGPAGARAGEDLLGELES